MSHAGTDVEPADSRYSALAPCACSAKRVLDVCCGPRMMWFDPDDPRAVFMDRREETVKYDRGPGSRGRRDKVIAPDVLADFTDIPFPDESFDLVVFDPPHLTTKHGTTGKLSQTYGVLFPGWEEMLAGGFKECFRVLRGGGTLIFKWCEAEVPFDRVIKLTDEKPLFGHRSGKKANTHWVAFIKQNAEVCDREEPTHNNTNS